MEFLKTNSYYIVRMIGVQISMAVFGTIVTIATRSNDNLLLVASLFSIAFYLGVLYTVVWDIGARDKIKIDGGRMRRFSQKGLLISFYANVPNLLLAILMGLGILINTEWSGNMFFICNMIVRLIQGMYLGVAKIVGTAIYLEEQNIAIESWWIYLITPLPAILTGWFSYYMGSYNKRISEIFGIKLKNNTQK